MENVVGGSSTAATGRLPLILCGECHIANDDELQNLTAGIGFAVAAQPAGKVIIMILIDIGNSARTSSKCRTRQHSITVGAAQSAMSTGQEGDRMIFCLRNPASYKGHVVIGHGKGSVGNFNASWRLNFPTREVITIQRGLLSNRDAIQVPVLFIRWYCRGIVRYCSSVLIGDAKGSRIIFSIGLPRFLLLALCNIKLGICLQHRCAGNKPLAVRSFF